MCSYTGYFPKIQCILCTCNDCSVNKFKDKILAANRDKLSDARKRFLVKLWITETERKEGKVQSFLHWKFERCSYLQLINLLQNHITSMAEHSFMASWNYWQYKLARRNIIEGDVIMVHDFAQNYLCTHQNEVQGLHWHHQQVTVMPMVAHYLCTQCKCMVTHEMVHISDELKHDAHLVKAFTPQSEQILEDSGIAICKIIEFTHQAPSQYKNKTSFHYMKDRKFPVVKNFFGVHHGKSSCDACTGRVNQGVTRLVKAGTEVVNSAQTFYECCVKHLQKPKTTACQHYVLQFELHKKLKSRPDTKKWPAVPDTRTYHSVANIQNDSLDVRTFSCCCQGCLQGDEPCSNVICPDDWKQYNLRTKNFQKADRKWWLDICQDQIHKIQGRAADEPDNNIQDEFDWAQKVACIGSLSSYNELQEYVNNNPLPNLNDEPNDTIAQEEINNLDMVALHHIPHDAPQRIAPVSVEGDGNCFPRAISYLLYKTERR